VQGLCTPEGKEEREGGGGSNASRTGQPGEAMEDVPGTLSACLTQGGAATEEGRRSGCP
jgi:hypothetical protein